MKLAYIDMCGFRGYRKTLRLEFSDGFTIIDGRNGVGKSTIFDAVEFALTGTLSKYKDAKADGESVADYIWWKGRGDIPLDYYVDVGFRDGDEIFSVKRTQFGKPDSEVLARLSKRICDISLAPEFPLEQLCATAIIRDEHIAGLSLDLKEADRYALLRDGLGASDSDNWIARGALLVNYAKKRSQASLVEVNTLNNEVTLASRKIDAVRASLVAENVIAEAVQRLREFSKSLAVPDQLAGPVREQIASIASEIDSLKSLLEAWSQIEHHRSRLPALRERLASTISEVEVETKALLEVPARNEGLSTSALAKQAKDLVALIGLGREVGLQEGHCPLCAKIQKQDEFLLGVSLAEGIAKKLDETAAIEAEREQLRRSAEARIAAAQQIREVAAESLRVAENTVKEFDSFKVEKGILATDTFEHLSVRIQQMNNVLTVAQRDLRVIETIQLNNELEKAQREELQAKERLSHAQERSGQARKAEGVAQALHDAARRAAAETLDRRLERVLPLMSELYRRLRPHPVWRDIEYSIRGDVRRFMKLQVGSELNPQFLFSSGQRRATGLAFLLSVNLSLAWSRWRTIMLDDPVQHVDDFRTVHLAELAAQLVAEGRQIVCAVEDVALADLLCRRLPVTALDAAKRITLGPDESGDLAVIAERQLAQMPRHALLMQQEALQG